jgi:hypothetical protein
MHKVAENPSERRAQWRPTPTEAQPFLELLASAEAYPRCARLGGRLRRVV